MVAVVRHDSQLMRDVVCVSVEVWTPTLLCTISWLVAGPPRDSGMRWPWPVTAGVMHLALAAIGLHPFRLDDGRCIGTRRRSALLILPRCH